MFAVQAFLAIMYVCVCVCVSLTYRTLLLMSGHCRKLNASNSIEIKL